MNSQVESIRISFLRAPQFWRFVTGDIGGGLSGSASGGVVGAVLGVVGGAANGGVG